MFYKSSDIALESFTSRGVRVFTYLVGRIWAKDHDTFRVLCGIRL